MISIFILAFTLIFFYFSVRRAASYGLLLSPFSSIVIVSTFSVFLPSLLYLEILSSDYIVFNFIVVASFIAFFLLINDSKWFCKILNKEKKHSFSNSVIVFFASIYFIYLLTDIFNLVISHGGLVSAFSRDRLDTYLTEGIRSGSVFQIILLIPSISYYILIGKLLNEKKIFKSLFFILFLVFYYLLTANTRLPIIMPIAAFTFYFFFFEKFYLVKRFGFIIIILSVFFVSIFSFFANLLRHGILTFEAGLLASMHEQNLNQLKYPIWVDELIKLLKNNELSLSYGFNWFVTPIVNIIPRAFWPDKPLTSTSNVLSEKVYGITVGDGSPITTFTIWGEGYWQFGLVGVFFAIFFYYLLFRVISEFYSLYKDTEFYLIFVLINWVPFVRAEMPVFYTITSLVGFFFLVALTNIITAFNRREF